MTDLPAPPNGDREWSIVTLADHLSVTPAAVDACLEPPDEQCPDLIRPRARVAYVDVMGHRLSDCYLTRLAAERIATELPAVVLAFAAPL